MAAAPCRRRGDSAKPQPGIGRVGGAAGCALGPSPLGNRPQKVRSVSRSVIENLRDFHSQKFALVPIFFSTGVRRTSGQTPAGACPDQRVNRHRSAKSQKAHRLRLLAATGFFVFEMSGNILLSEQP